MKRQKRLSKGRKVGAIRASAEERGRPRDLLEEVGRLYKPIKKPVTLRLDADVLAWFKKRGKGYQTRINRALRKLMMEEKSG